MGAPAAQASERAGKTTPLAAPVSERANKAQHIFSLSSHLSYPPLSPAVMAVAVAVTTSAQAISSPLLTLSPCPGRSLGLLDRVRPRPPRACATATAADVQRRGILGPGAKEISVAERAAQHRYFQSLTVGLILERLFSLLGRIWSAIGLTWLATDTTVGRCRPAIGYPAGPAVGPIPNRPLLLSGRYTRSCQADTSYYLSLSTLYRIESDRPRSLSGRYCGFYQLD